MRASRREPYGAEGAENPEAEVPRGVFGCSAEVIFLAVGFPPNVLRIENNGEMP